MCFSNAFPYKAIQLLFHSCLASGFGMGGMSCNIYMKEIIIVTFRAHTLGGIEILERWSLYNIMIISSNKYL